MYFFLFRDHCAELGNPVPTKPLLFMKPPSSYLEAGTGPIEVVIRIGKQANYCCKALRFFVNDSDIVLC